MSTLPTFKAFNNQGLKRSGSSNVLPDGIEDSEPKAEEPLTNNFFDAEDKATRNQQVDLAINSHNSGSKTIVSAENASRIAQTAKKY